jgi:hypothetical protein
VGQGAMNQANVMTGIQYFRFAENIITYLKKKERKKKEKLLQYMSVMLGHHTYTYSPAGLLNQANVITGMKSGPCVPVCLSVVMFLLVIHAGTSASNVSSVQEIFYPHLKAKATLL